MGLCFRKFRAVFTFLCCSKSHKVISKPANLFTGHLPLLRSVMAEIFDRAKNQLMKHNKRGLKCKYNLYLSKNLKNLIGDSQIELAKSPSSKDRRGKRRTTLMRVLQITKSEDALMLFCTLSGDLIDHLGYGGHIKSIAKLLEETEISLPFQMFSRTIQDFFPAVFNCKFQCHALDQS